MLFYFDYIPFNLIYLTDFPDIYYDGSYDNQFILYWWVSGINNTLGWVHCCTGIGMDYTDSYNIGDGKEILKFSFIIDFGFDICIHNGRPFRAYDLGSQVCLHQDFLLYHRRWTRIHPQALKYYYRYKNGVFYYWPMPDGSVEAESEMTHYAPFQLIDLYDVLQPSGEFVQVD